jgi:hypothetical protein
MTHHRARLIAGVQLVVDAATARGAQLHDGVAALDAEETGGTARVARDAEKLEIEGRPHEHTSECGRVSTVRARIRESPLAAC